VQKAIGQIVAQEVREGLGWGKREGLWLPQVNTDYFIDQNHQEYYCGDTQDEHFQQADERFQKIVDVLARDAFI
jgi:hypothetical protein